MTELKDANEFCDALTDAQDQMARELLGRVAGKWPLWVLSVLADAQGPIRFSRVLERVEGISQKVLTQTLRHLERDGLLTRTLYPQVPPRVEYELTSSDTTFCGRCCRSGAGLPDVSRRSRQYGRVSTLKLRFDA